MGDLTFCHEKIYRHYRVFKLSSLNDDCHHLLYVDLFKETVPRDLVKLTVQITKIYIQYMYCTVEPCAIYKVFSK